MKPEMRRRRCRTGTPGGEQEGRRPFPSDDGPLNSRADDSLPSSRALVLTSQALGRLPHAQPAERHRAAPSLSADAPSRAGRSPHVLHRRLLGFDRCGLPSKFGAISISTVLVSVGAQLSGVNGRRMRKRFRPTPLFPHAHARRFPPHLPPRVLDVGRARVLAAGPRCRCVCRRAQDRRPRGVERLPAA